MVKPSDSPDMRVCRIALKKICVQNLTSADLTPRTYVNIRCLLVTVELLLNEIKSEVTIILLLDTVTATFSKVLLVYMSFTWVLITVARFILHRL